MEARKYILLMVAKINPYKGFDVFPICNLVQHQEKTFDL